MIQNLQLVAIMKDEAPRKLHQIPLQQDLQRILAASWHEQLFAFTSNIREIDFNAGYSPETDERFRISDFRLPDWLRDETSENAGSLDPIGGEDSSVDLICGIVALAQNSDGLELQLFQNFSNSHIIRPGFSLFFDRNTYRGITRPGLTLDKKLSAVYYPSARKLLFHNFRNTNTFLPLADFYEEASEDQIREVLAHRSLAPENPDSLAIGASQWFRKRFAMLRDSRILEHYTPEQIQAHSAGYETDIQLAGDRIVFPADKTAAKRLLQFLNEEIFRGAITNTLYETNSKREADSSAP